MKIKVVSTSLMLLLAGGMLSLAAAQEVDAFREISEHYEAIRLSLVKDTMMDVTEHARAIEHRVHQLGEDFEAAEAGVPADNSAEFQALLPEVASAAALLAASETLGQAREALFDLSKPMGRYRKLAGIEGSMVVYCSMAKKAWIQPHGDIGNPYLGEEMTNCGEVIAD